MWRRWLQVVFRVGAAGSALVLVGVLILWPVSYSRWDTVTYDGRTGWVGRIDSHAGRISATEDSGDPRAESKLSYDGRWQATTEWDHWSYRDRSYEGMFDRATRFLGYERWESWSYWGIGPHPYGIRVPYSYFALSASILPALWLIVRLCRRRKRHAPGLCPICGYDLRAHRVGERCPECGAVIPVPAAAEAKP